jgi:hypothetical protein
MPAPTASPRRSSSALAAASTGQVPPAEYAVSNEVAMTIQPSSTPFAGAPELPSLRTIFSKLLDAFIQSRQRSADREIARHLHHHKRLQSEYRLELERRFTGQ